MPWSHQIGRPTKAATGTSHARSVRPAYQAMAAAIGSRTMSGGTPAGGGTVDAIASERIHSAQSAGASRTPASAITAVAPRATARLRHSRRATNQTSPTPDVTLVNSTNAQADEPAGAQRIPTQMASAMNRWTFPLTSSRRTGGNAARNSGARRPVSSQSATRLSAR